MKSGRLYSLVTQYWPRIAAGLVVVIGLVEFVVGGLTADSGVELYLLAWAGTTGGLWFLFEKAENALSKESRDRVVGWIGQADWQPGIASIPSQFLVLFDRVFGEKHLSLSCLGRSAVATTVSVLLLSLVYVGLIVSVRPEGTSPFGVVSLAPVMAFSIGGAIAVNILPDYLSLFETRWVVARATSGWRLVFAFLLDIVVTTAIGLAVYVPIMFVALEQRFDAAYSLDSIWFLGFPSTFFTSVWLWLYAASVLLSRVLLKMNSGVGFLLGVTDVKKQPFRSMGFVSVLIVSGLFLLGLPLVLL